MVNTWAEKIVNADVRTPGIGTAARALSGGNLQKFVIGREIMQDPDVIIVNQPTWGVDAAARRPSSGRRFLTAPPPAPPSW